MISIIGLFVLLLGLSLFFLPSLLVKGRLREDKITLLNVFFGTNPAGWLCALIWAFYQRGQLPSGIISCIKRFEEKLAKSGPWVWVLAGFIFLLIWDYKDHKRDKFSFELPNSHQLGPFLGDLVSLKWLPMCVQFLMLMFIARLVAGRKSISHRSAMILAGSVSLVLFSLHFIKPPSLEYFLILWGSCIFYTFSLKE